MQVIVLENQPTAFRGGQHLSLLDVCRGLSQRGHKVNLLYEKEGDLLNQYQQFCSHVINVDKYSIYRKVDIFQILLDTFKVSWQLPIHKNTIVYSNQYQDSLFGSILALAKNIPFVCHLRQCPPKQLPGQWSLGLKGAKRFIVVSKQAKLDWIASGINDEKIDVVYNAINTDIFKPTANYCQTRKELNIPEDTTVISYVGRLDQEKGIETLIKAFALLPLPTKKLMIAGSPVSHSSPEAGEAYKQSLENLATTLGIKNYVNFLGHVTNTRNIYQVSDLIVLPSLCSEPFGRTIVESMACGTPVVASRIGGIPEIITGEFKIGLFEPGNQQDLANAIARVLAKPQLVQQCRQHVLTNFSLEQMVGGVEKSLLQVVK